MRSIFLAFIYPRIADYTQKKKQEMSLGSITFGACVSSFLFQEKTPQVRASKVEGESGILE